MVKANKQTVEGIKLSLPSFRDGIAFTVRPITFGALKRIARVEAQEDHTQVDTMDVMVSAALQREFADVTGIEIDELSVPDLTTLANAIGEVNGDTTDFTTPTNTIK